MQWNVAGGASFSIKAQESTMAQNLATHQRKRGLRGRDKQQSDLTDQTSGQGIGRDQRGQDQPKDRKRAQRSAGLQAQQDAAQTQPQSPGQPARGE
jgi:hypothetical protein